MIAFEVTINGTIVCVAGVGDRGVLTAMATWVKRDPDRHRGNPDFVLEELEASIGGKRGADHVSWGDHALAPGDVVQIRVVEADAVDPPTSVSTFTSEEHEAGRCG